MAGARTPVSRVVLASILIGALHIAPDSRVLSATPAPQELTLALTTTQALAPASEAALIGEATAIWRDSRIRLRWLNADEREDTAPDLRVLVMARVVPRAEASSSWTVGELIRGSEAPTIAIASITGARRIVEEARL